jgi:hypothetical protein
MNDLALSSSGGFQPRLFLMLAPSFGGMEKADPNAVVKGVGAVEPAISSFGFRRPSDVLSLRTASIEDRHLPTGRVRFSKHTKSLPANTGQLFDRSMFS